ncbi:MAG: VOC family protein [Burkholderiales bacterium]|nr:VOC family protein [Burkholderiales bacterium]
MQTEYLEHANLTVTDLDEAVRFITTALPSWQVRGRGLSSVYGNWVHVGTADHYIAIYDGGDAPRKIGDAAAFNHIGLVVPSLDAVIQRLAAAGYAVDHPGGKHPHRRVAYFRSRDNLEFEFVEYLSEVAGERNDYSV